MSNKKLLTPFVGYFEKMSTPESIVVEGKAPKKRAVVTIVTEDEQKAFFEVRDAVIKRIDNMGIRPGDQIEIGFVFIGSEKNGRTYNNLFINQIDYVNLY
jgi:DNA helicase TIP49 (TBP-interacting protein)